MVTIALDDGSVQLDANRLGDFIDRIEQHRKKRVDDKDLWAAFRSAFPSAPAGPAERRWMLAALLHARDRGAITFPSVHGSRWDRAARPILPRSVDRCISPIEPIDEAWRRFPWHPSLAWVSDIGRTSGENLAFLRRVHDGLVRDEFLAAAPLKYRSLALTGDEKRLEKLVEGTTLFGPGKLSYELLGCLPNVQPLAWESVGDAPVALVFENAEPFIVALTILREIPTPPYGVLGWGHGASVSQSIQWLGRIGRPIRTIHYVGDLDRPGLDAALSASRQAQAAGLPAVEPAPALHSAMFAAAQRFGHPDGWPYETPGAQAGDSERVLFIPEEQRTAALRVLTLGHRIAEEVLGPNEMLSVWR
jgi:hypothetical protein